LTSSRQHRPLDIIVPIYRNAALARRCVESLIDNLREIDEYDPHLFLINDSPDDVPVNHLLAHYESTQPNVVVWRNDENVGFVRTVNRGLEAAARDGHDVLLVNSDTQTFPGTLSVLLTAAKSDPQIGFASLRSNNASICSLPHGAENPTLGPAEAFARWAAISKTMPPYH
jgi:GT2 family glycosyltransferase